MRNGIRLSQDILVLRESIKHLSLPTLSLLGSIDNKWKYLFDACLRIIQSKLKMGARTLAG